jgi:Cu+-exporting ATPase
MARDPVCGMSVDDQNSTIQVDYDGRTFHFCSEECKEVFQTNPEPYANSAA